MDLLENIHHPHHINVNKQSYVKETVVNQSKMAWSAATLSVLLVVWFGWHGLGLSCYSVEWFKRVQGPPLYLQQWPPTPVARQMGLCASWCADIKSCLAFSWSPGLCTQVGPTGTGNTAPTVFVVKKNITVEGRAFWFFFASSSESFLNGVTSFYLIHCLFCHYILFLAYTRLWLGTVTFSFMLIYYLVSLLSAFLPCCRTPI